MSVAPMIFLNGPGCAGSGCALSCNACWIVEATGLKLDVSNQGLEVLMVLLGLLSVVSRSGC
jgi:hypothetical protein